jgi:hypothetical protein
MEAISLMSSLLMPSLVQSNSFALIHPHPPSGYVKPSRRMRFAATCSLSSFGGIVPEADPLHLKTILEKLEMEKRNGPMTFKPPIPSRYRFEIFVKLSRGATADDIQFLTFVPQDGQAPLPLYPHQQ